MIKRKTANQFGLKSVCQFAGLGHVLRQVLLERHETVLRAIFHVEQFDFADGRPDRGNVDAVLSLQVPNPADFRLVQLHDVLDAVSGVNETQCEVLKSHGGERGELLFGRLLVCGFVGKTTENDTGSLGHGELPQT